MQLRFGHFLLKAGFLVFFISIVPWKVTQIVCKCSDGLLSFTLNLFESLVFYDLLSLERPPPFKDLLKTSILQEDSSFLQQVTSSFQKPCLNKNLIQYKYFIPSGWPSVFGKASSFRNSSLSGPLICSKMSPPSSLFVLTPFFRKSQKIKSS